MKTRGRSLCCQKVRGRSLCCQNERAALARALLLRQPASELKAAEEAICCAEGQDYEALGLQAWAWAWARLEDRDPVALGLLKSQSGALAYTPRLPPAPAPVQAEFAVDDRRPRACLRPPQRH